MTSDHLVAGTAGGWTLHRLQRRALHAHRGVKSIDLAPDADSAYFYTSNPDQIRTYCKRLDPWQWWAQIQTRVFFPRIEVGPEALLQRSHGEGRPGVCKLPLFF